MRNVHGRQQAMDFLDRQHGGRLLFAPCGKQLQGRPVAGGTWVKKKRTPWKLIRIVAGDQAETFRRWRK